RLAPTGSQPSSAIVTPAPPAAGSDSRNPAQYGELSRNSCTARRSAPVPIPCTTRTSESPARTARSRKAASASVASRTRWPIRLISAGAAAGRSNSIATRSRAGAAPTTPSWPDGTSKRKPPRSMPARPLARAQVLGERLGLLARGRQAGALPLDFLAVRLVGAAALLQAGDRAREVAALAGEQPLRRLERARREPVAARDRQRQALAH